MLIQTGFLIMSKEQSLFYNENFIKTLKKKVFFVNDKGKISLTQSFKEHVDILRIRDKSQKGRISILGRDGTWLSKELDKWKKKIFQTDSKETVTFNGTLQNLEIYCRIVGADPNSVLLNKNELFSSGASRVTYLTFETIEKICEQIKQKNDLLEEDWLLPVEAHHHKMLTLFIKIYRNTEYNKDIQVAYFFSEYDINEGGIVTYQDETDDYIVNLSCPYKSKHSLREVYEAAMSSFEDAIRYDTFKESINDCLNGFSGYIIPTEEDFLFSLMTNHQKEEIEAVGTVDNLINSIEKNSDRKSTIDSRS